ncbi:type II toxin-antitoxin system RelE/ParE family toxin [Marinomonas sp. 2405UD68-3]|uniref:type II toxin-antitoxin system RelE/ParE family toxin n=1 Tax=Marinomonas sp. 2405UD68-3 TaxID=3391835 RepID=UPI0039C98958
MWEILVTDKYERWFLNLSDAEQEDVLAMIDVLEIKGLYLSRPYADTLKGTTKVKSLKELRVQHVGKPYRIFLCF